jgi:predicted ATPase
VTIPNRAGRHVCPHPPTVDEVQPAPFLREIRLDCDVDDAQAEYPFSIPAVRHLAGRRLRLHPAVTFFAGENGSGKSTLIEAVALAGGFNAEGGPRDLRFSGLRTESILHESLVLTWNRRPRDGFFLRAETFFNAASALEATGVGDAYGDRSLHEQSHGESFLALVLNRFGRRGQAGLYLLDEPEAAFSFQGCLRLLAGLHDLVSAGCQFLVATHSPILLAYPSATIYQLDDAGIAAVEFEMTDAYQLTSAFLEAPERFFRHLFAPQ